MSTQLAASFTDWHGVQDKATQLGHGLCHMRLVRGSLLPADLPGLECVAQAPQASHFPPAYVWLKPSTSHFNDCSCTAQAPHVPRHICSCCCARRSAITQWEPRQPEPLLAWFDAWSPLLPRGACQTLLQGLVMPRIAAAVEAWDPTRETQPIHAWLHPWLPYLSPELASVYPTIRSAADLFSSRNYTCVLRQ